MTGLLKVVSEALELDVYAALAHCGRKAALHLALCKITAGGDQAQETECVGEDARRHQQRRGDENDDSVEQRISRQSARLELPLYPRDDSEAFSAGEAKVANQTSFWFLISRTA